MQRSRRWPRVRQTPTAQATTAATLLWPFSFETRAPKLTKKPPCQLGFARTLTAKPSSMRAPSSFLLDLDAGHLASYDQFPSSTRPSRVKQSATAHKSTHRSRHWMPRARFPASPPSNESPPPSSHGVHVPRASRDTGAYLDLAFKTTDAKKRFMLLGGTQSRTRLTAGMGWHLTLPATT